MNTIANLGSLSEAQILQAKLKAADIDAFIPDESGSDVSHIPPIQSGVRLQVAEKDVEKAIEVINEAYSISV